MEKRVRKSLREFSSLGIENELLMPYIEMNSNRLACVEGCKGIIEYEDTKIRLNCKTMVVKFTGAELCITTLCEGLVRVTGQIASVEMFNM